MQKRTLGLALGAGGARGACHLGFLQALRKHGIIVDFVSGCSMGAVIGGGFASGTELDDMEKTITKIKQIEFMDISFTPIRNRGVLRGNAAKAIIERHLVAKTFDKTVIPFSCVAVDLLSGKCDILDKGDLATAIKASFSIPGVFEPVKLDGKLYVDGGVLCRLPIQAVRQFNPDVVIAVDAMGEAGEKVEIRSVFDVIARSFDLLDWEHTKRNLDGADLVICPKMDAATVYQARCAKEALAAGFLAGEENINKIKELLEF